MTIVINPVKRPHWIAGWITTGRPRAEILEDPCLKLLEVVPLGADLDAPATVVAVCLAARVIAAAQDSLPDLVQWTSASPLTTALSVLFGILPTSPSCSPVQFLAMILAIPAYGFKGSLVVVFMPLATALVQFFAMGRAPLALLLKVCLAVGLMPFPLSPQDGIEVI
jgi:hypothetical protein